MGSQSRQDLSVPDSASQDPAAPMRLPSIPSQSPDLTSFADTTYMTQPGLPLPLGLNSQAYPQQFSLQQFSLQNGQKSMLVTVATRAQHLIQPQSRGVQVPGGYHQVPGSLKFRAVLKL